ncbi:MAG: hypothetical protein QM784_40780 [Polyangiaceae bacterium]
MNEHQPLLELARFLAGVLVPTRIEIDGLSNGIRVVDEPRNGLNQMPKPRLALAKSLFDSSSFGDVANNDEHRAPPLKRSPDATCLGNSLNSVERHQTEFPQGSAGSSLCNIDTTQDRISIGGMYD